LDKSELVRPNCRLDYERPNYWPHWLKVDVHKIFDARGFAIVPKIAEAETFQYATHILSSRHAEFWPTHHDILVQNLRKRSRPYLFARFAWAVLLQAKDFIIAGQRRVVQLHVATDKEGFETEVVRL
jgi:hypothetical protein